MFDPNEFQVGAVTLIVVVFGLTQFFKEVFNLDGNKVRIVAFFLGAVVMVAYKLLEVVPEPYGTVVNIVFYALMFALTAAGYYQFDKARREG